MIEQHQHDAARLLLRAVASILYPHHADSLTDEDVELACDPYRPVLDAFARGLGEIVEAAATEAVTDTVNVIRHAEGIDPFAVDAAFGAWEPDLEDFLAEGDDVSDADRDGSSGIADE